MKIEKGKPAKKTSVIKCDNLHLVAKQKNQIVSQNVNDLV